MKKLFYLFPLFVSLISGCTFSATKDGVTVVGSGGGAHIDSSTIIVIVIVSLIIIGVGSILTVYLLKRNAKNKVSDLEKQYKEGKITKEHYESEKAKWEKLIK